MKLEQDDLIKPYINLGRAPTFDQADLNMPAEGKFMGFYLGDVVSE